jgi:nucleoside-specific outer membrane channel protein Tsx
MRRRSLGSMMVVGLLCQLMTFGSQAKANQFVSWHSTNLQVLRGADYKLTPQSKATVLSLEHANQWQLGDFFAFADYTRFEGAKDNAYGELTTRFSLNKFTDRSNAIGPFQDFFVTTQLELGKSGTRRYLKGFGTDLQVPGFKFFKANLLHRNNPQKPKSTWQVYLAWKSEFQVRGASMVFEGFIDLIGAEGGSSVSNQLFVPRLLLGLGHIIHQDPHRLQVGVEWQYWHNKFGVRSVTESAPQLQLKFTL